MRFLAIVLSGLVGCHSVCGSSAPIWVQADCALTPDDEAETVDLRGCDAVVDVFLNDQRRVTSAGVPADDVVVMRAEVTNLTSAPLQLALVDRCPDDLLRFEGLGDDMDVYGTCMEGVCPTYGETYVLTLGVDEVIDIPATVAVNGDDCHGPLPEGEYTIVGVLEQVDTDVEVCAVPATLVVDR